MKKTIAIIFILLVGLMLMGGCASNVKPANQEQTEQSTNTESQQNQQQAEINNIPQPPALPE